MINFALKLVMEHIGFPLRWRFLKKRLSPYLADVQNVLDLGASDGRLAHKLKAKNSHLTFTGVDTHVQKVTYIPIKKYDGKKLPFPDKSFDCVMIIDVLHHDKNPERLLREAKRVSKKYILIKDHYFINRLDHAWLSFADNFGNNSYGIHNQFNYFTLTQWQAVFKTLRLSLVRSERFRYIPIDPCRHIIFLLSKTSD